MTRQILSGGTALLFSAGAAHSDNVFWNGSFWSPIGTGRLILPGGSTFVTGWTTALTGLAWFDASDCGGAAYGGMVVDLANDVYSAGGVEQTISTVGGTTYALTFSAGNHLGSGRTGTCVVKVTIDGVTQAFDTAVATTNATLWKEMSFELVPTQSQTVIRIGNAKNADRSFPLVDGVSMKPAVPEPLNRPLLIGGLGLVG